MNNKIAHVLSVQEQATVSKTLSKNSTETHMPKKIIVPQILDQSERDKVCGPEQMDQLNNGKRIVGLIETISCQHISTEIKFEVIQREVATCPRINIGCGRKRIPSLLDSDSQVTVICQSIPTHTRPSGWEKAEAHQLFQLTAANNGRLPISMYVELDFDFLGIVVPKVGVLITQEPNKRLDEHHKTKFPGIINWNLIKYAYQVFIEKFGLLRLENFNCPTGISLLLFSQLCVFHHSKAGGIQLDSVTINMIGQQQLSKKKPNNFPPMKMGYWTRFG